MHQFMAGLILGGGIHLCISGFSKKGLPLTNNKRLTGRAAKVVGLISLIVSMAAAAIWAGLPGGVDAFLAGLRQVSP